jgi:medium-chain acyl-[acyl-carrier-protein] hydrolase
MHPVVKSPSPPRRQASLSLTEWVGLWPAVLGETSVTVLCFPYAGGGASIFRDWHTLLPAHVAPVPIRLPGRETRWPEPAYTNCGALVAALMQVLGPVLRGRWAAFGHSMGALIAFEFTRAWCKAGRQAPMRLFASGCRPPHLPDPEGPIYASSTLEFLLRLKRYNGVPSELLRNAELMELMLPTLRADFQLFDTYVYADAEPIPCPISAFGGYDDRNTTPEQVELWRVHTASSFTSRMFAGDHFFLRTATPELLQAIAGGLRSGDVHSDFVG